MRVLHVVPDSAVAPEHRHLGSTKDIRGRTEYLQAAGLQYDELAVVRRDSALRASLEALEIGRYDSVLMEIAVYPRSMAWLRRQAPRIIQILRPMNAGFLQQLHLARLAVRLAEPAIDGLWPSGRALLGALQRITRETGSARRADFVLAITEWERTKYWQRLTAPSKVVTVPYFLPREYSHPRVSGQTKADRCVCLTSSTMNPFLLDAARNFESLVDRLGGRCANWQFFISGEFESSDARRPTMIARAGFVNDLTDLLGPARAIALLSDYGVGFKTKVLDAVRHECYMLVTARLYERMPIEVRPFCIVVDPSSVDSFADALDRCRQPYPEGDPNEALRQQAFRALDAVIRGH